MRAALGIVFDADFVGMTTLSANAKAVRQIPETMFRVRKTWRCLLFVCTLGVHTLLAQGLPSHVGKVNDFAELLDASQRQTLELQLSNLER